MIELTKGNLLEASAEALVNTVNTEGVMGKGIALQFKQAFPEMYKVYEQACKSGMVKLGHMHVYDLGGLVGGPHWIINFPTKGHWKARSRLADIDSGLQDLVSQIKKLHIKSIAIPPLGCGHGGLDWSDVYPRIQQAFSQLNDVKIFVYPPEGTPVAKDMPIHTDQPNMTQGRASLLGLMDRYLQGLLDPFVSLLEIHKLMYFMQEAGQDLRLNFEAHHFGPYAVNLRHVLIKLEGHYLSGYGDGEDTPTKPIEMNEKAISIARDYLNLHPDVQARIERVSELIDGFEDPYGMELLSTMHWIMCHFPEANTSVEVAISKVHAWNERKRDSLKPHHLAIAWERLKLQNWDREARSASH